MKSSGPTKSKKVVASRSTTVKKTQVNRGDKGEENLGSTLSQLQLGYEQSGDSSTLMTVFGPEAIDGIKINNADGTSYNGKKTPSSFKSDIQIVMNNTANVYHVSVKTTDCSPPSLMNSTSRDAWVFMPGNPLHNSLPMLDEFVHIYIIAARAKSGSASAPSEDVKFLELEHVLSSHPQSASIIEAYIDLLAYFMFKGTGTKIAPFPANSAILWNNSQRTIDFRTSLTDNDKRGYAASIFRDTIINLRPLRSALSSGNTSKYSGDPWAVEYTYNRPGKPKDGETIYKHQLGVRLATRGRCSAKSKAMSAAAAEAADGAGAGADPDSEMMMVDDE